MPDHPTTPSVEIHCHYCRTRIEVTKKDLMGGSLDVYYVECPNCMYCTSGDPNRNADLSTLAKNGRSPVSFTPKELVHDVLQQLKAAESEETAAREKLAVIEAKTKSARADLTEVYLALYNELPMEVRNHVRFAINASAKP